MNKWTKALQEALEGECDVVPKGWQSGKELDKVFGSVKRRQNGLCKLVKAGLCEVQRLRRIINGKRRIVPYYKLK